MTNQQKRAAEKKADVALSKLLDLYSGYDITHSIATRLDTAANAIREVIYSIQSTETKRKNKV